MSSLDEMRTKYPEVNRAFWYAVKAHRGQTRKDGTTPYITHPVEAAEIGCTLTDVPSVIIACLLHDTVEDTDVKLTDIYRLFGPYVAELVLNETENKRRNKSPMETWRMRKEEGIKKVTEAGKETKIVALCDKLSNLRSMKKDKMEYGDDIFNWFNNPNKKDHEWYYRSMADQFGSLRDTKPYEEYLQLLEEIFKN